MNKQRRVVISARSRAAHYACARARVNDGGGSADDGDDAKRDDNNNVTNNADTRLPACSRSLASERTSRPPLPRSEFFRPAGLVGPRPSVWGPARPAPPRLRYIPRRPRWSDVIGGTTVNINNEGRSANDMHLCYSAGLCYRPVTHAPVSVSGKKKNNRAE